MSLPRHGRGDQGPQYGIRDNSRDISNSTIHRHGDHNSGSVGRRYEYGGTAVSGVTGVPGSSRPSSAAYTHDTHYTQSTQQRASDLTQSPYTERGPYRDNTVGRMTSTSGANTTTSNASHSHGVSPGVRSYGGASAAPNHSRERDLTHTAYNDDIGRSYDNYQRPNAKATSSPYSVSGSVGVAGGVGGRNPSAHSAYHRSPVHAYGSPLASRTIPEPELPLSSSHRETQEQTRTVPATSDPPIWTAGSHPYEQSNPPSAGPSPAYGGYQRESTGGAGAQNRSMASPASGRPPLSPQRRHKTGPLTRSPHLSGPSYNSPGITTGTSEHGSGYSSYDRRTSPILPPKTSNSPYTDTGRGSGGSNRYNYRGPSTEFSHALPSPPPQYRKYPLAPSPDNTSAAIANASMTSPFASYQYRQSPSAGLVSPPTVTTPHQREPLAVHGGAINSSHASQTSQYLSPMTPNTDRSTPVSRRASMISDAAASEVASVISDVEFLSQLIHEACMQSGRASPSRPPTVPPSVGESPKDISPPRLMSEGSAPPSGDDLSTPSRIEVSYPSDNGASGGPISNPGNGSAKGSPAHSSVGSSRVTSPSVPHPASQPRLDEIISLCTRKLEEHPDSVRALFLRGLAYMRLGDHTNAIRDCTAVLQSNIGQLGGQNIRLWAVDKLNELSAAPSVSTDDVLATSSIQTPQQYATPQDESVAAAAYGKEHEGAAATMYAEFYSPGSTVSATEGASAVNSVGGTDEARGLRTPPPSRHQDNSPGSHSPAVPAVKLRLIFRGEVTEVTVAESITFTELRTLFESRFGPITMQYQTADDQRLPLSDTKAMNDALEDFYQDTRTHLPLYLSTIVEPGPPVDLARSSASTSATGPPTSPMRGGSGSGPIPLGSPRSTISSDADTWDRLRFVQVKCATATGESKRRFSFPRDTTMAALTSLLTSKYGDIHKIFYLDEDRDRLEICDADTLAEAVAFYTLHTRTCLEMVVQLGNEIDSPSVSSVHGASSTGALNVHATASEASVSSGVSLTTPGEQVRRVGSGVLGGHNISWTKGAFLGRGATGVVYSAIDNNTNQFLAVKEFDTQSQDMTPKQIQAFTREISVMSSLSHPNIVHYYGCEVRDSVLSVLLEYLPGGSLATHISRFGPLKEDVLRKYVRQILSGLGYLHDNNLIHGDVKGANVLLSATGDCKLTDFGCARNVPTWSGSPGQSPSMQAGESVGNTGETLVGGSSGGGGDSSQNNSRIGSPNWMAPEVIRGEKTGPPCDVWSAACTVIELATGSPPWGDLNPFSAMYHITVGTEFPPLPDSIGADGQAFLRDCLQRDPRDRPRVAQLLDHPWLHEPALPVN